MTKNALLLAILSGFLLSGFLPDFPLDVYFSCKPIPFELRIPVNLYRPTSTCLSFTYFSVWMPFIQHAFPILMLAMTFNVFFLPFLLHVLLSAFSAG
jgi:hypothetical protein